MTIDAATLWAILAMAAVTYLTRIGGFWLVQRLPLGPRARHALEAVPGAVLVAVIAPAMLTKGPAALIAAMLTVLAALRLPLLAVVAIGVGSAAALRAMLG